MPNSRTGVLLPLPVSGPYDYLPPANEPGGLPARGTLVRVPFGRRYLEGVVWGEGAGDVDAAKLKPIRDVLEAPPLPGVLCDFIDWVAAYTLHPPGAVLKMALGAPGALAPPETTTVLRRSAAPQLPRMTEPRQRVLDTLAERERAGLGLLGAADLARAAGVSAGVVSGLVGAGVLEPVSSRREFAVPLPDGDSPGPVLSDGQRDAADALGISVSKREFEAFLLHGVTGSGKTEVYFDALGQAFKENRQGLVLLPEIALAARWPERFEKRFGVMPLTWHSRMTPAARRNVWRAVASGEARVVIGARSALFLPFPDLGLIVVDEEHDASYKQDEGVAYNARDMAVVRAKLGGATVVLASATPSLETMENATQGRYQYLHLPERHGAATLPRIDLIDLKRHGPERWYGPGGPSGEDDRGQVGFVSPPLVEETRTALAAGEQVLFYLNRRGYAPLTVCRACGDRIACPHCTAWLVEHRGPGSVPDRGGRRLLVCHHCGFSRPVPPTCPSCSAEGTLFPCGPGVERLAEEVAARFPEARVVLATSDTLRGPAEALELGRRMTAGEIDIVIGTQIMAKGHHFPLLTLVGVIDGDMGLSGGDPRAAERTYQLLHQVAGRAGRAGRPGRVFVQTLDPRAPVMQALRAGDPDTFMAVESRERQMTGMPPWGRLVALIVSAEDEGAAQAVARALGKAAPEAPGVRVLGPAPAPLSRIRNRSRFRLLLKAEKGVRVQAVVRSWLQKVKIPSSVRLQVDVDPVSFL
ncbi:primosomal protein N' [Phaeovibrio sulfidiphilus]|uniref:Replication restart protein PriA n=1 Tax=Phaeovibrio sulfidiphilus TaxID=1220600 RepID=A0A8J7CWL0_9PROT|nr:primosomal protein N' [Phaeovibrio sulfidiphilus]MBE1237621.1 primosomal protein N' [Phaeovibrio sulfidiphilus]